MGDEVQIKKSTIFVIIGILLIGGFVLFAFRNIFSGNNITGNGVKEDNSISSGNDAQVINLGVANYNYYPNVITVESGKKVKIIGNMNQLVGCLRAFTIPNLGIYKVFRQGDNILEFTPTSKGTFGFSCTMGMGTGTLIIK